MKRFTVLILAFIILSVESANATEGPVKHWFEKKFPGAQYVTWEKQTAMNMYAVRFVYMNHNMVSYVDLDGSIRAIARMVSRETLPFIINETIAAKYKSFRVLKIEELIIDNTYSYLVALDNEKISLLVRIDSDGAAEKLNRTRK